MALVVILATLLAVVSLMLAAATLLCIDAQHLRRARAEFSPRFRQAAPSLSLLGLVLLINSMTRQITEQLSGLIGINISGVIWDIEGSFVAELQTIATPELTAYFSFVYVFGYVFLLVFPLIAYFVLDRMRRLHQLAIAYTANYTIGLLCYLLFISFGPRNIVAAEQMMYDVYPRAQLLTSAINTNTNVFPSLHTSLSFTVMLFAWRTRDIYPRWCIIALPLGMSIIGSTMYLGIHWAVDVIGGIGLGAISYLIGIRAADRWMDSPIASPDLLLRIRHRF